MSVDDEGTIEILPFDEASFRYASFDAVISVENPGFGKRLRFDAGPGMPEQLVVAFDDVDHDHGDAAVTLANASHVEDALAFARRHLGSRLLVHCQAGKCRSPAVALAIISERLGAGHEDEAVETLMRIRPQSFPNLVFVAAADVALDRGGALVDAWARREAADPGIVSRRARKTAAYLAMAARDAERRSVHHGPSR